MPVLSFQYLTDAKQKYTASLQPVRTQINVLGIKSTIDPDFIHVSEDGQDRHNADHIQYTTPNGSTWSSKCHSHTEPLTGNVSFTFEHSPISGPGEHHEDQTINFVSWEKESWWLSAPDIGSIPAGSSVQVQLDLRKGDEPVVF